jgi:hypothetical protein
MSHRKAGEGEGDFDLSSGFSGVSPFKPLNGIAFSSFVVGLFRRLTPLRGGAERRGPSGARGVVEEQVYSFGYSPLCADEDVEEGILGCSGEYGRENREFCLGIFFIVRRGHSCGRIDVDPRGVGPGVGRQL